MKKRINSHITTLWLILFRLTLDIVYINIIVPMYGYNGYVYVSDNAKYFLSWIAYIGLSFIASSLIIFPLKPSSVIALVLFCMSYVPASSLFGLANLPYRFFMYVCIFWGLLLALTRLFLIKLKPGQKKNTGFKNPRIKDSLIEAIAWAFGAYILLLSFRYNRLYINLNLENVYELRSAAALANFGGFNGYLMTWAAVVFSFAAIRYYEKKMWSRFLLICYLQLLLFSINGMRTTLFFIPIAIIGYILVTPRRLSMIPLFLTCINLGALLFFVVYKSVVLTGLLIYRVYYIPAMLGFQYFDFFSKNPPDMLAQSVFRRLGSVSRYDIPIPYLIDSAYSDGKSMANTGMFGDAFANFGPFGSILYPILFTIVFKVFDIASIGLNLRSYIVIVLVVSLAFSNVSFFTALLSNGLLMAILLLSLQNRPVASQSSSAK